MRIEWQGRGVVGMIDMLDDGEDTMNKTNFLK